MKYILCVFLLVVAPLFAFAQENVMPINDGVEEYFSGTDPEEQVIALPHGAKFEEGPPVDDVIEAVGTVTYSAVVVYSAADKTSKVLRYAIPGEKVIITASNAQWYCVRMYNGREGFVERRNLKTMKVFYDESVSANYMDKRISIELQDLVTKFNNVLAESVYVDKFQIIPRLTIVSSAKRKNVITLTLEYCAVDSYGSVIPSRQDNMLQKELQNFVELLFMKMLPANADEYAIVVRKPVFSENGRVLNTQGAYAEISLKHENVDIKKIRESDVTVLSVAKTSIPRDKLFLDFPN